LAWLSVLQVEAEQVVPPPSDPEIDEIPDERLRLLFACCHPALSVAAHSGTITPPGRSGRAVWLAHVIEERLPESLRPGAGPALVAGTVGEMHDVVQGSHALDPDAAGMQPGRATRRVKVTHGAVLGARVLELGGRGGDHCATSCMSRTAWLAGSVEPCSVRPIVVLSSEMKGIVSLRVGGFA
jgi:hypothetical protein